MLQEHDLLRFIQVALEIRNASNDQNISVKTYTELTNNSIIYFKSNTLLQRIYLLIYNVNANNDLEGLAIVRIILSPILYHYHLHWHNANGATSLCEEMYLGRYKV